ncbi:MAG TPA: hypothetical protein VEC57_10745 [Candidatus Limnocylindrales bacterium]|nr:hypothetical protein [Candidatus Limnocylindrales bacterium]
MQPSRFLRRLLVQAVLVAGTWMALLLLTAVAGDLVNLYKHRFPLSDERAELPNYSDKEAARAMFADIRRTVEDYVPFVEWRRLPMQTGSVTVDERGYRVHRRGPENNRPDSRTIGFFGGSTMWGQGAPDDGTIPAIFDQKTDEFVVTNYGESGHTSRQQLDQLLSLVNTGQMPQVVVFYDGFNHVWTHCNYGVTTSLNGHMAENKLRRALTETPALGFVYSDIIAPPVEFVRRIIGEKKFIRDDFCCHDDPVRARQVAETLVETWRIARDVVEARGGRLYVFLQPNAYLGRPRIDHLRLDRIVGAEQFRAVYPLIQAILAERRLDYVTDLTRAFDGQDYIYIDDAHVSPNGNAIIAARMIDRIRGAEAVGGRPSPKMPS